jgi:hypothetical protein
MYRGKDLQWWMDAAGGLDERYDAVDDINGGAPSAVAAAIRHAGPLHARPQRTR